MLVYYRSPEWIGAPSLHRQSLSRTLYGYLEEQTDWVTTEYLAQRAGAPRAQVNSALKNLMERKIPCILRHKDQGYQWDVPYCSHALYAYIRNCQFEKVPRLFEEYAKFPSRREEFEQKVFERFVAELSTEGMLVWNPLRPDPDPELTLKLASEFIQDQMNRLQMDATVEVRDPGVILVKRNNILEIEAFRMQKYMSGAAQLWEEHHS
jgi:hypothetical protein